MKNLLMRPRFISSFLQGSIILSITCLFILGFYMVSLNEGMLKHLFYEFHKIIGIAIFILAMCKLIYYFLSIALNKNHSISFPKLYFNNITRISLTVFMIILSLTGILMSVSFGSGINTFFKLAHQGVSYLFVFTLLFDSVSVILYNLFSNKCSIKKSSFVKL